MKYLVHQFTPDRDICINVVRGRGNSDDRTRPDSEHPNTAICQSDALQIAKLRKVVLDHFRGIRWNRSKEAAPYAGAKLNYRPG